MTRTATGWQKHRPGWRAPSSNIFRLCGRPDQTLSTTFEETDGYDEMIVLRGIPFESHCEHHVAPIIGRAWVAYVLTGRVVGISKLARVVEAYAKRLQI